MAKLFFNAMAKNSETETEVGSRYLLWIDGVGGYLLCLGERVTIGGPHPDGERADISLLGNLARKHATFVRDREGYLLEAHSPTYVADRPVDDRTHLKSNYDLKFGSNVKLKFRLPTVLSGTARLDFVSDHRPAQRVDGIMLMEDSCLMGPESTNHVVCSEWPEAVLLYRRDGKFWCKSRSHIFVDGEMKEDGGPIEAGQIVNGLEFRFRLEAV